MSGRLPRSSGTIAQLNKKKAYRGVVPDLKQKHIVKLRARVASLRGSDVKPSELISLVEAMGRTKAKRGKHPTYIGGPPGAMPISIPNHSKVKRFTAGSILDQIEQDLDTYEELLNSGKKTATKGEST